VPDQLSPKEVADLVKQKQLAELAFRTAEKQVRDQQGSSVANLVTLRGERDRLYVVFVELDRQVKALQSIPTP